MIIYFKFSPIVLSCGLSLWPPNLALSQSVLVQESQMVSNTVLKKKPFETEFAVDRGILKVIRGKKSACRTYSQFVLAAFKSKNVTLRGCHYRVSVWSGEVNAYRKSNAEPMQIYTYFIDVMECKKIHH
jgi:hypothetical protein